MRGTAISRTKALALLDKRISMLEPLADESHVDLKSAGIRKELRETLVRLLQQSHTITEDLIVDLLVREKATNISSSLTTGAIQKKLNLPTRPLDVLHFLEDQGQLKSMEGGRPFQLLQDSLTRRLYSQRLARRKVDENVSRLFALSKTKPEILHVLRRMTGRLEKVDEKEIREKMDVDIYNKWIVTLRKNGLVDRMPIFTPVWLRTSSRWWYTGAASPESSSRKRK